MKTVITTTANPETGLSDYDVDTELPSADILIVTLLLVVEKMTGVSADDYIAAIDEKRG